MLSAVKQFFSDHIQPQPTDGDGSAAAQQAINIAAAALLIEVGRADFDFSDSEQARIAVLLRENLQIADTAIDALIQLAKRESTESTSLHGFTRLIHDNYTPEQKRRLMQQLWCVALADDQIDKYEDYVLRKIAELIYLSHQEFIQAKLRAMN